MKSTFKVSFFTRKEIAKEDGTYPIYVKITIDNQNVKWSLFKSICPKLWDKKQGRVIGKSPEATELNEFLSITEQKIQDIYLELRAQTPIVTPYLIKSIFLNKEDKVETVYVVLHEFLQKSKELINISLSKKTYTFYVLLCKRFIYFLENVIDNKNLALKELTADVIEKFSIYLKEEFHLSNNTHYKMMVNLRKIFSSIFKSGKLRIDPFADLEFKKEYIEKDYLNTEELKCIINYKPYCDRLQKVKDLFIFCCFTGIDYSTLMALTPQNISKDKTGNIWVIARRVKTNVPFEVKLMPLPLKIYNKYEYLHKEGRVLPKISVQCFNLYLKDIAILAGVSKNITTHMARHTFATMAYNNGAPLQIIQKALGQSKRETTEIYAKITATTISNNILKLNELNYGQS